MKIKLPILIENTIEDVYLFYINIKNAFYNFFHFLIEAISFYRDPILRNIDVDLFKIYAFKDQFAVAIEEGQLLFPDSKEELTYGEAMWQSIDRVFKFINPKPNQKFYDLGCGVGRICFLANIKYNLDVTGIDLLPTFIDNAQRVVYNNNLENIRFIEDDWLNFNFDSADIIYVAATCLENDTLILLKEKILSLKKGSHIISVTHSIDNENLKIIKKMFLPFSWGKAEVYISKVI